MNPRCLLAAVTLTLLGSSAWSDPIPDTFPPTGLSALDSVDELLFVVRAAHDDWFHPTGERRGEGPAGPGTAAAHRRGFPGETGEAAVCRLDLRTGRREIVWQAKPGDIRGCRLHDDGRRLLLSVREGGPAAPYRLAELPLAARGEPSPQPVLQYLTDGMSDAIDPEYLEDGAVLFSAGERNRWLSRINGCGFALWSCESDGRNPRAVTSGSGLWRTPVRTAVGDVLAVESEGCVSTALGRTRVTWWQWEPDGSLRRLGVMALPHLSLMQARPLEAGEGWVAVAVPAGAVTREKGWLAVWWREGVASGPLQCRVLGVESERLEHLRAASAEPGVAARPLQVEHTDFRWRYPYGLSATCILAVTDQELCVLNGRGEARVLFRETEVEGELASVQPLRSRAQAGAARFAAARQR